MKEIIVAIDFSACSLHALDYAVLLANKIEANIQMVWVDTHIEKDSLFETIKLDNRSEIKANFEDLCKKYHPKLSSGKISYKLRKGKIYIEIAAQAIREKAYIIIVGTHGVSGYEELWIGSNAYRIVTHAPCPVITLRQSLEIEDGLNIMVLPIDSTIETLQKLPFAVNLAKIYDATIHLISVYPTFLESLKHKVDANSRKAIQCLEENKVNFVHNNIRSDDLTKSTIAYAVKVEADLVAIMTDQGVSKKSVSLGQNAQQLVSNSTVPLLVIRPENNKK